MLGKFWRNTKKQPQKFYRSPRKQRIVDFFHSRFAVLGIIIVLVAALLLNSLAELQLGDGTVPERQETRGISRQMKVEAPRGDILDGSGLPLAYNEKISNIYIAYAGLNDEELNAVLLDTAKLFEEYEVSYGKVIDDYLDLDTMTFSMGTERMLEWQQNTNFLGLKPLPKNVRESSKDIRYVKETPQVFYDYMRNTRFHISDDFSEDDQKRIFRLRFQIYLNNWYFRQGEPILLANDVPDELVSIIQEQNFRYIGLLEGETQQRNYTDKAKNLSQVIGYVGSISAEEMEKYRSQGYGIQEKIGKAGIESVAEQYLHGTGGVQPYRIWTPDNKKANADHDFGGKSPIAGYDVQLTVRMDVQEAALDALKEYIDSVKTLSDDVDAEKIAGTAVMINLKDGGSVIAMANYPNYDPQDFITMRVDDEAAKRVEAYLTDNKLKPMMNRAISQLYAPGSTFKTFIGVSAANHGIVDRETQFDCQQYIEVDGQRFRCTGHHGKIDMENALAYSCNIYFYQCGMQTGIDQLTADLKEFQLGEKTGIELSGEAAGVRPSRELKASLYSDPGDQQWFPADTAQISIGQGLNSYTVLQLARATGGIATGYLTNPHIIKRVTAQDGSIVFEPQKEDIPLKFNQYSRDIVREGMRAVITDPNSTAYSGFLDSPVTVAGKTGTAETNYGGGEIVTNGLFICFAPYDNPEVAIAVAAESGARGAGVSSVAAAMIKQYYSGDSALPERSVVPSMY